MSEYKKIVFHTTAWYSYVDIFKKLVKPSIEDDIERLKKDGYKIEFKECSFDLTKEKYPTREQCYSLGVYNEPSYLILKDLRKTIRQCHEEKSLFFLLQPDTIWAQGSIYNLVKLSVGKKQCIAVPHLRVASYDDRIKKPTGRQLVEMCFKYPHRAFTDSFDTNEKNCTWSGLSIRHVADNIYTMVHNMPTVYLAKFEANDVAFWDQCPDFGMWDRNWCRSLFVEHRMKILGNSDVAFCIELTNPKTNAPPIYGGALYNDLPAMGDIHNYGLNYFYSTIIREKTNG